MNTAPDSIKHPCFWCGEMTATMFHACDRCRPLKEEGYRRAKAAGAESLFEIYQYVYEVLRENGVELKCKEWEPPK